MQQPTPSLLFSLPSHSLLLYNSVSNNACFVLFHVTSFSNISQQDEISLFVLDIACTVLLVHYTEYINRLPILFLCHHTLYQYWSVWWQKMSTRLRMYWVQFTGIRVFSFYLHLFHYLFLFLFSCTLFFPLFFSYFNPPPPFSSIRILSSTLSLIPLC